MKIKKILLTCLSVTTAGALIIPFLTSCSSIDKKLIDDSISHGDYNQYSTSVSFDEMVKYALSDTTGQNAIKKAKADQLIYDWYMQKAEENKDIKESIDTWNKEIDKAYKDAIQSSKDTNKNNWEYYFQNDILVPAGGYESTYKHAQLVEKMRADFVSQVFSFNYLGMKNDDGTIIRAPTETEVRNANNWDQIGFYPEVNEKYNSSKPGQTYSDFAAIQQFVFDTWFKDVDPYVISMSLWMYTDPKGGLKKVYNEDYISDATKLDTISYAFPYFQHSTDNVTITAQDKFFEFTHEIMKPDGTYDDKNLYVNQANGTISIPPRLSDDTSGSTLIVAKSQSMFADLDTQFAAAAADALLRVRDLNTTETDYTNSAMPVMSTLANWNATRAGEQDILTNFLLKDQPFTGTYNDLAAQYGKTTIGNVVKLFNPQGVYKDVKYAIDAFLYENSPFTFIRDSFGVHVIAIDGGQHIKSASDEAGMKQKQKEILLYRAYESQLGHGKCGTVDIIADLTTYFDSHIDDIIIQMAQAGKIFGTNETSKVTDAEAAMYDALRALNTAMTLQSTMQTADDKMLTYSQPAVTQYELDISNNGLLSRLPYSFTKADSTYDVVSKFYNRAGYLVNPVSDLYNDYKIAANAFLADGVKIVPNKDTNGIYKYTQIIMATEEGKIPNDKTYKANAINSVLYAFGGEETTNMGNTEKLAAFKSYLQPDGTTDYYDFDTGKSAKYDKYLDSSYFQKSLLSAEKPLSHYKYDWQLGVDNSQANIDQMNSLMASEYELSRNTNSYKTDVLYSDENIAYYTMLSTIKYLSDDNYEQLRLYLQQIITPDNPAVVAWTAQENLNLNPGFATLPNTTIKQREAIYGWKDNPNNMFGSVYQVEATNAPIGMYTMFDQYWQNAPMGTSGPTYMGFMGLQTKNNNTFPTAVSTAAFDKLIDSSPAVGTAGVLNAYGSRADLKARIEKMTTISDVEGLARKLQELIPSLDIQTVLEVYKPGTTTKITLQEKIDALVVIVSDTTAIPDSYFERIAFGELNNPLETGSKVIYNDPATSPIGTRTTIYQVNAADLKEENWPTLIAQLGDEIMMQICIQYAQGDNSSLQTLVTNKVIAQYYGDGKKATVYDARMNDQLGRIWVNDWKEI